jgi:hypothetical protein
MLVLASKSYPPLMHSQLNVMNAANITSQRPVNIPSRIPA